MIAFVKI